LHLEAKKEKTAEPLNKISKWIQRAVKENGKKNHKVKKTAL